MATDPNSARLGLLVWNSLNSSSLVPANQTCSSLWTCSRHSAVYQVVGPPSISGHLHDTGGDQKPLGHAGPNERRGESR